MKTSYFLIILCLFTFSVSAQDSDSTVHKPKTFENGTIISSPSFNFRDIKLDQAKTPYDTYLIGVFFNDNSQELKAKRIAKNPYKTQGLVYVKFNSSNGQIKAGDPVTSSSTPGEAMKATQSGMILGIALEDAKANSGLIKVRILIQYLNF